MSSNRNIVLIGMPGAGKSTVGVLLAKALRYSFIDTDVMIQSREGRGLQEIIDSLGADAFCRMEERRLLELELTRHVIATGGSAVYSRAAMEHLKRGGLAAWLYLPLELLARRLDDQSTRGIVFEPGQTLAELFAQRRPLYEKHADLTIDTTGLTQDQVVAAILNRVR